MEAILFMRVSNIESFIEAIKCTNVNFEVRGVVLFIVRKIGVFGNFIYHVSFYYKNEPIYLGFSTYEPNTQNFHKELEQFSKIATKINDIIANYDVMVQVSNPPTSHRTSDFGVKYISINITFVRTALVILRIESGEYGIGVFGCFNEKILTTIECPKVIGRCAIRGNLYSIEDDVILIINYAINKAKELAKKLDNRSFFHRIFG